MATGTVALPEDDAEERRLLAEMGGTVPRLGVSLATVRSVLEEAKRLGGARPTTSDVCRLVVLPVTGASRLSFVDYLWQGHHAKVAAADAAQRTLGRDERTPPASGATVFVSHCLARPFEELVGALEHFVQRQPEAASGFFWIDTLSVNQHAVAAGEVLSAKYWASQVCVVATPWRRPAPLTRCWCLWELFSHCGARARRSPFACRLRRGPTTARRSPPPRGLSALRRPSGV
jgi:hypothetical protein